jgi:hypothetical protein
MLHEGDRVTWIDRYGEQKTGTIRWEPDPRDITLMVNCDQVLTAGGVPIGRIERPRVDIVRKA